MHHSTFVWVAATIVAVLSVARTARLICWDDFPPWLWAKERLMARMGDKWGQLLQCQFCITPYLMTGMVVWAWISDLNTWWFLINGVWGFSYLAAITVAYDQSE